MAGGLVRTADPSLRTEPFDALKYISLSQTDPNTFLSLGATLRERFETNDAPLFGTVPGRSDSYVISRLETHADFRTGPVQMFSQLQSDFAPGKAIEGAVDSNRLDLEQGFVALVEPLGAGILKLRLGRQQFAFDLQRFVSVRDGPNVRQSFDAAWADYETGPWRIIAYYTLPVATRDDHPFDDYSSSHNRFYGFRLERHVLGTNELSAYWSRLTNDDASYLSITGPENRDVFDARFAGHLGSIDWDAEGMFQTGSVGADQVRAWAIGSRFGYTLSSIGWKPRLGIQGDAASGDENPSDRTLQTFNPLFPNGSYLSLAGYTGYVNFIHLKPSITVAPTSQFTIMAALAAQWRETINDAVYTQPNVPVPHTAGTGSPWTGAYAQLRADWTVSANVTTALEAVHFWVENTIRNAGGHDSDYVGAEVKLYW